MKYTYIMVQVAKLYKIFVEGDNRYYVGATIGNINTCLRSHRSESKRKTSKVSNWMREMGVYRVKIVTIEEFTYESKRDVTVKENEYIMQHLNNPNCLNMNRRHLTTEERREAKKKYYVDNREKILAREKKYRSDNRERIKNYQKERIMCNVCNCFVKRYYLSRHRESKKHLLAHESTNR